MNNSDTQSRSTCTAPAVTIAAGNTAGTGRKSQKVLNSHMNEICTPAGNVVIGYTKSGRYLRVTSKAMSDATIAIAIPRSVSI